MRFHPASIDGPSFKAGEIHRHLETAGFPISEDDCRRIIALAFGFSSWHELKTDIGAGHERTPYDEELDFGEVAARHHQCVGAVMAVTGLPLAVAHDLAEVTRFMGDPAAARARRTVPPKLRKSLGSDMVRHIETDFERRARGFWRTPEELGINLRWARERNGWAPY